MTMLFATLIRTATKRKPTHQPLEAEDHRQHDLGLNRFDLLFELRRADNR